MPSSPVPGSAYRLQLNGGFPLSRATALLDYLRDLGVRTLYLSPLLAARPGSSHGYDVTDPKHLWADLGTEADLESLAEAAARREMSVLVDLVPNHMYAGAENPWWADVLEFGRDSPYADYFDIDWAPAHGRFSGRVFLPILDEPLEDTVRKGSARWSLGPEGVRLHLSGISLPVSPASLVPLVDEALSRVRGGPGTAPLARALDASPESPRTWAQRLKEALGQATQRDPDFAAAWRQALTTLNDPARWRVSLGLLGRQPYLPGPWKDAHRYVNYRRFFQVNDLVGMRVEDPEVFQAMHALPLDWEARGWVGGFRIDHIDGLRDPEEYLDRLSHGIGGTRFPRDPERPYVVVEKILLGDEHLPERWAVDGTTGYDFLASVPHALVDPEGLERLQEVYQRFVGAPVDYREIVHAEKRRALEEFFPGRLERLLSQLLPLSREVPGLSGLPAEVLRRVLSETLASYPRYRTYLSSPPPDPSDVDVVSRATSEASRWNRDLPDPAFQALGELLLLRRPELREDPRARTFALDVQQFTGGVMAKGTEDAALYRYHRLVALNEVGGDPAPKRLGPELFHQHQARTLAHHPHTLTTTSTHDTKRSEDVRARLFVLAEMPGEWESLGRDLHGYAQGGFQEGPWGCCPLPNQEYFLYQTLVGAWPNGPDLGDFPERLYTYLTKALREGGVSSSWGTPDLGYEAAFLAFARRLVEGPEGEGFRHRFLPFQRRVAYLGAWNSLSQVLLKVTAPGIPDLYQGCELFDLSLVDPDNRRPVDFALRERLLRAFPPDGTPPPGLLPELRRNWSNGRIKLYLTQRALLARAADPGLFTEGRYLPLSTEGSEGVLAFAREKGGSWAVPAVPRLPSRWASPEAGDFTLKEGLAGRLFLPPGVPGRLRNALTGEEMRPEGPDRTLSLAALFQAFPVALLVG